MPFSVNVRLMWLVEAMRGSGSLRKRDLKWKEVVQGPLSEEKEANKAMERYGEPASTVALAVIKWTS